MVDKNGAKVIKQISTFRKGRDKRWWSDSMAYRSLVSRTRRVGMKERGCETRASGVEQVIENAMRVPRRRSLSASLHEQMQKAWMQLKRHEPARKAYGRERRLLTQAEASSLARLPVGNDRRDSREPTVHSGLMIAYSIGSYSIEIMPTHFTPYSIDNIDNSPFSSPLIYSTILRFFSYHRSVK